MSGPCQGYAGAMLGLCWARNGIFLGPVSKPKRTHRFGAMLGLCVGPMLGPCWAYVTCWSLLAYFGPWKAVLGPCWAMPGLCQGHAGAMLSLCSAKDGLFFFGLVSKPKKKTNAHTWQERIMSDPRSVLLAENHRLKPVFSWFHSSSWVCLFNLRS